MLRIAVAQFNATVGDLTGNVERIVECAVQARARGAQVLLTPELALCGYPPEDLLLRPDFHRACARHLARIAAEAPALALLVGQGFAVSLLVGGLVLVAWVVGLVSNPWRPVRR